MLRLYYIFFILCIISTNVNGQIVPNDIIYGGSENGIVGKIEDEIKTTSTGQLQYIIPISTVSGTGGMSPKLSVAYNSSNGNGLFGYGFDLLGVSVISRAPENLYRDGDADVIRFDSSDRFSLDGMRLSIVKQTATYREYKTETNNFSKIIAEGNTINPSKFTVYTKDGLIREYLSAKALMGMAGDNLYWLETKVSDTKGNYYTISYAGNTTDNEYRPIRIDYTGNNNANLTPYASVRFTYQRINRSPTYISGVKSLRSYVINNITCYYGEQQIKKYEIQYASVRGKLFIKQISEYAGNEKKNPTKFTWNNDEIFSVIHAASSSDANFKNRYLVIGDFNGDGKSDFLTRVNNNKLDRNYNIYISNGNTFNSPISGQFIIPQSTDNKKRIEEIKSGDFNGDGYDDLVVERANSPFYAIDLYLTNVKSDGTVYMKYEKSVIPAFQFVHTMTVMDANCDGAADLFIRESNYAGTSYFTLLSQSTEYGVSH